MNEQRIATYGLVAATLILVVSIAWAAITGQPLDVTAATLAGSALTAIATIARPRSIPTPPVEPDPVPKPPSVLNPSKP